MEALANGFMVMVYSVAGVAVLAGSLGGAMFWRGGRRLALGLTLWLLGFSAAVLADIGLSWRKVLEFHGLPALIMTFLISYLAARILWTRAGLRPRWSIPVAMAGTLIVGFAFLSLYRANFWAPIWLALGADVPLIALAIRNRRFIPAA